MATVLKRSTSIVHVGEDAEKRVAAHKAVLGSFLRHFARGATSGIMSHLRSMCIVKHKSADRLLWVFSDPLDGSGAFAIAKQFVEYATATDASSQKQRLLAEVYLSAVVVRGSTAAGALNDAMVQVLRQALLSPMATAFSCDVLRWLDDAAAAPSFDQHVVVHRVDKRPLLLVKVPLPPRIADTHKIPALVWAVVLDNQVSHRTVHQVSLVSACTFRAFEGGDDRSHYSNGGFLSTHCMVVGRHNCEMDICADAVCNVSSIQAFLSDVPWTRLANGLGHGPGDGVDGPDVTGVKLEVGDRSSKRLARKMSGTAARFASSRAYPLMGLKLNVALAEGVLQYTEQLFVYVHVIQEHARNNGGGKKRPKQPLTLRGKYEHYYKTTEYPILSFEPDVLAVLLESLKLAFCHIRAPTDVDGDVKCIQDSFARGQTSIVQAVDGLFKRFDGPIKECFLFQGGPPLAEIADAVGEGILEHGSQHPPYPVLLHVHRNVAFMPKNKRRRLARGSK